MIFKVLSASKLAELRKCAKAIFEVKKKKPFKSKLNLPKGALSCAPSRLITSSTAELPALGKYRG